MIRQKCHNYQQQTKQKMKIRSNICFISMIKSIRNYQYSQLKTTIHNVYTHPIIKDRVQSFRQIPEDIQPLQIKQYSLNIPEQIKMTNGKKLREFHIQNKTLPNVVILHALAHIQLNAFLAYADTYFRFGCSLENSQLWTGIDKDIALKFRKQIKRIALDQGQHCLLLINRLNELGHKFGEFPVISNLTNTIYSTNQSVIDRLALISIVHQGKGIRSIERLINKVLHCHDQQSVKILKKIQSEEVYHFQTGLKWFKYFCQKKHKQNNKNPEHIKFNSFLQKVLKEINQKYKTLITFKDIKVE